MTSCTSEKQTQNQPNQEQHPAVKAEVVDVGCETAALQHKETKQNCRLNQTLKSRIQLAIFRVLKGGFWLEHRFVENFYCGYFAFGVVN